MAFSVAQDLALLGGDLLSADGTTKISLADGSTGAITFGNAMPIQIGAGGYIKAAAGGQIVSNSSSEKLIAKNSSTNLIEFPDAAGVSVTGDIALEGGDITNGGSTAITVAGTAVTIGGTITLNSQTYTFPATQTANYVLKTDGSGGLSWAEDNATPRFPIQSAVTSSTASLGASDVSKFFQYDTSANDIVVTLAAASGFTNGDTIKIKLTAGSNVVKLTNSGSDTIDGTNRTDYEVLNTVGAMVEITCNGSDGFLLS